MPVPAGPRRAGPPRRRPAAKSPAPSTTSVPQAASSAEALPEPVESTSKEEVPTSAAEHMKAQVLEQENKEGTVTPVEEGVTPPVRDEQKAEEEATSIEAADTTHAKPTTVGEEETAVPGKEDTIEIEAEIAKADLDVPGEQGDESVDDQPSQEEINKVIASSPLSPRQVAPEEHQDEEVEEDEATRRKRIADRIAKTGGFNPFTAPPPPRRLSAASGDHPPISPHSVRSPGSPGSPPRIPGGKPTARKSSADSHKSGSILVFPSTSPRDEIPRVIRRDSSDSVRVRSPVLSPSLQATHAIPNVAEEPETALEEQDGK